MANVAAAMLCDFAQIREGLLFVSSGGLARFATPDVPIPFPAFLALIIEVPAHEVEHVHELAITVKHVPTATTVAKAGGGFSLAGNLLHPGESAYAPQAIALHSIILPDFGAYDVTVTVDTEVGQTITAYVVEKPASPQA